MLSTAGTTNYCYAADGTKLAVRDAGGNGFAYLGSLILSPSSTEFQFLDGVIRKTTSGYEVNYFLKDHLGSVRTVVNAAGEVVQQSDYYPFGSKHENATYVNNSNRFLYNGKELQTTGNLGFLDYGARMYDAKLGRFFTQDRFSEKYTNLSQYQYGANNPICNIDVNGDSINVATGPNGSVRMTLFAKVYNDSDTNYSENELNDITSALKTGIENIWQGESDGISYSTNVVISVAKSVDDIENSDHVIYLGEDGKMNKYYSQSKSTVSGMAVSGGNKIAINTMLWNSSSLRNIAFSRTIAHEFGHSTGLVHPYSIADKRQGNIMYQHIHPEVGSITFGSQVKQIRDNFMTNKLNNGNNKSWIKK